MIPPITVDVHEVEHGDRLFGMITPVDQLLTDGIWWYYAAEGVVIAKRRCGTRVQVVRAQDVVEGAEDRLLVRLSSLAATPSTATSPGERPGGVAGGVDASSGASPASRDWCDPRGIARSHGLWVVVP